MEFVVLSGLSPKVVFPFALLRPLFSVEARAIVVEVLPLQDAVFEARQCPHRPRPENPPGAEDFSLNKTRATELSPHTAFLTKPFGGCETERQGISSPSDGACVL
ncbi:hypothetical protein BaRGS_00013722 [Batillaria attramentaria]|uniref:Secreted protein n=1 Tax=Batillaria attramentaria TaxID=370345 RepID=A0ABD0L6T7_9CAEN